MIDPVALSSGQSHRDAILLFSTRIIRLFCYGLLSIVLALYLAQVGLDEKQIGLLFALTLAGDAAITLWLTGSADRFGRKRTLLAGALLMAAAISPALTGFFLASPALVSLPFFLSGSINIIYDLLLYRSFMELKPPEENKL